MSKVTQSGNGRCRTGAQFPDHWPILLAAQGGSVKHSQWPKMLHMNMTLGFHLVVGQTNQASLASICTYRMERRHKGVACVLLSGTSQNCGQPFLILMRSLKIDLASTIAIILECAHLVPLEIHASSHQGNFPKPSNLPTIGWMETRKVTATS